MSQPGFPRGEVTERSEDQGEGKGPHRYGLWWASVAEWTPLSAPISLLIDRNYTITV